jgi:inner membrane protein YidH
MTKHPIYSRFETANLILRDELAIDRTLLANERTLLSYLRSAVALIIAGVSIIHFSHQTWFTVIGIACLPTGLLAAQVGAVRYRKMDKAIAIVRKELTKEELSAGKAAA